jgi:internalin A
MLSLHDNKISDITPLITLTDLTRMSLSYIKYSDITSLSRLINLKELSLYQDDLSQSQIEELQNLLPDCEIS